MGRQKFLENNAYVTTAGGSRARARRLQHQLIAHQTQ